MSKGNGVVDLPGLKDGKRLLMTAGHGSAGNQIDHRQLKPKCDKELRNAHFTIIFHRSPFGFMSYLPFVFIGSFSALATTTPAIR